MAVVYLRAKFRPPVPSRQILQHAFTAAQIAELLQGTVEGDPKPPFPGWSKIEEGGAGFAFLPGHPAYAQYVYGTTASVVIIGKEFPLTAPVKTTLVPWLMLKAPLRRCCRFTTGKRNKKGVSTQA